MAKAKAKKPAKRKAPKRKAPKRTVKKKGAKCEHKATKRIDVRGKTEGAARRKVKGMKGVMKSFTILCLRRKKYSASGLSLYTAYLKKRK